MCDDSITRGPGAREEGCSSELTQGRDASVRPYVALLIGSLRGGGTERVCLTLANSLVERGYDVDLVVLNLINAKYQGDLNARVRLVNLEVKTVRWGALRLWRYLANSRPQLVLTFAHQLAVAIVLMQMVGLRKHLIVARTGNTLSKKSEHARGVWNRYLSPWLTRRWYASVDRIIAQSHGMARDLMVHFGVPHSKLIEIPNPVSPRICFPGRRGKAKRESVLFVGRLDPAKDPLFLLRAFRQCVDGRPDLKLDIVGAGSLEQQVRSTIHELGLTHNVEVHGFRTDVGVFYGRASLTLLCSHFEGLPNCLLESISLGTPVVAMDCEHGPREIIEDGINGFLVTERDEQLFAQTLCKALDHTWDSERVAATADRFRPEAIVLQYDQLISTLLKERCVLGGK